MISSVNFQGTRVSSYMGGLHEIFFGEVIGVVITVIKTVIFDWNSNFLVPRAFKSLNGLEKQELHTVFVITASGMYSMTELLGGDVSA